jgi:hypothetical protein
VDRISKKTPFTIKKIPHARKKLFCAKKRLLLTIGDRRDTIKKR